MLDVVLEAPFPWRSESVDVRRGPSRLPSPGGRRAWMLDVILEAPFPWRSESVEKVCERRLGVARVCLYLSDWALAYIYLTTFIALLHSC